MARKTFSIGLTEESKRRIKAISEVGLGGELSRQILKAWDSEAAIISSNAIRKIGDSKRTRSGALRRGIVGSAELFRGVPALRVGVTRGPSLKYAGVQEFGTRFHNPDSPYSTIRPTRSKYLAFPPDGSRALYPSGVPRYRGPRAYPFKLVFIPYRKGRNAVGGLYAEEDVENLRDFNLSLRQITAVYVLIRKTEVKPGYFLRDAMTERLPTLVELTGNVIQRFFEQKLSNADN